LVESARSRENEWFLQHEAKLLEEARKAREKREAERREQETAEHRRRLKEQHFMKCPKCGHDLKAETLEGIEIDRCTFCEGFFVDAGELEELFQKKQADRQSFLRWLLRI
jgi:acetyl-CoA carboxylase beta subunit